MNVCGFAALVISFAVVFFDECQGIQQEIKESEIHGNAQKEVDSLVEQMGTASSFYEFLRAENEVLFAVRYAGEFRRRLSGLPASVDCQLFWNRIKGRLAETPPQDRPTQGLSHWNEFFGFLYGKTNVEPPDDWRYFAIHHRFPDDRDGATVRLKSGEEVVFAFDTDQVHIRGGNSYDSTLISRRSSEGTKRWSTEVFPLSNIEDVSRRTGPMSMVCLLNASYQPELDQLTVWGADSSSYCFVIRFCYSTGKKLDQCYFDVTFAE